MPDPEPQSEFTIHFDNLGQICITDPELARRLVRRALQPGSLDILVTVGAGATALNAFACPVPITNGLCPKPINPCPDGMCPLTLKLRFSKQIEQEWTSLPENA